MNIDPTILITDTLFINSEQEQTLQTAGYTIKRLPKPDATEEELIAALQGVQGYILGGIEYVTEKVIAAATDLRAIAFTGTDWKQHIPAWELARARNIAISNTPYTNANAMAEWEFATGLAMVRHLFSLGRTGESKFQTAPGFSELRVGIVGLGHIGSTLSDLFASTGMQVSYWSKSPKQTKYPQLELDSLLKASDIVCFCVSAEAGSKYIDAQKLSLLKNGAIVTATREICIDEQALLKELKQGRIRAYLDYAPKLDGYNDLPLDIFYCSNSKTGYNTSQANDLTSDMAAQSLLNLLDTREDDYRVL